MTYPLKGEKRVVRYDKARGITVMGGRAFLHPLDHDSPLVSNTTVAMTSRVVAHDLQSGRIETENTVYIPE